MVPSIVPLLYLNSNASAIGELVTSGLVELPANQGSGVASGPGWARFRLTHCSLACNNSHYTPAQVHCDYTS
jgi:hypothetical protein